MLSPHSRSGVCNQLVVATVLFIALASQPVSADGDPVRGKNLADMCEGCHAVDGYNNVYPTYHVPRIAGQSVDYLVSALQLYRDGNREHPTMVAQAASFSDQDIQDVAAWLSSAGPDLQADAGASDASAPQSALVCAACHGPVGISPIPANPHLAGQYRDYLEQALAQYKSGQRKGPNAIAMQAQLMALTDADLAELAAFYAAQDGLESLPLD